MNARSEHSAPVLSVAESTPDQESLQGEVLSSAKQPHLTSSIHFV